MRQRQLEFSVASAAIKGARDYQEDSTRVWRPESIDSGVTGSSSMLAVLADGMGGHVSGEVASRLVCDTCVSRFSELSGEVDARIKDSLFASNEMLARAIAENSKLSGMGCTAIVAHFDRDGLQWASVGDSSLLLYRNNQLFRVNEDHSLGAILDKQAAANLITYEEARNSPNRHSLRSALTGAQIPLADIGRFPQGVLPGDWVIVASDGLDTLTGDEIASIIHRSGRVEPAALAERLLREVSSRGLPNQDNTSVIVVRVEAAHDGMALSDVPATRPDNANSSSDPDQEPDTEVPIAPIRGTLVGQAIEDHSSATTVLLHPQRRVRKSSYAAATMIIVALAMIGTAVAAMLHPPLAALLQVQVLQNVFGGPTEKPTEPVSATQPEPTEQPLDPAVKNGQAPKSVSAPRPVPAVRPDTPTKPASNSNSQQPRN